MTEQFNHTHRLSDRVVALFGEAFHRHANGEKVVWDLGLQAFPDPSQPPAPGQPAAFIAVVVLYVEVAGPILGQSLVNTSLLQPNNLSDEIIDKIADDLVHGLLNERSARLADTKLKDAMTDHLTPQNNGHAPLKGGLIHP